MLGATTGQMTWGSKPGEGKGTPQMMGRGLGEQLALGLATEGGGRNGTLLLGSHALRKRDCWERV